MLDHVSFAVSNYERSKLFYDTTLAKLGYRCVMEIEAESEIVRGYGIISSEEDLFFEIRFQKRNLCEGDDFIGRAKGHHVAFRAPTVESIRQWYEACLSCGGKDNGKPGPRPHYHARYYGAFIIDLDGWRLEACLHNYGS